VVEPRPLIKDLAELVADVLIEEDAQATASKPAKTKCEPAEVH